MVKKIQPKTEKCIHRYNNEIKKLIWEGFSTSLIAKKINLNNGIILDNVKKFGSDEDKLKLKNNRRLHSPYKDNPHPRTVKCMHRYNNEMKKLIWEGLSIKELSFKFNLDVSVIFNEIRRYATKEDKIKVKENGKIKLKNINRNRKKSAENERRLEESRKKFFNIIKPLIWEGLTSTDISKKIGYIAKKGTTIRKHVKRFGDSGDYEKLMQNGIRKKRNIIISLMKNKTSKPEKMLFDILKKIYPSAKHKYKILSDKQFYWEMDIAIPEIKLNVEYDGSYWHEKHRLRDANRDLFLKNKGWKIVRIEYKESPTYEQLFKDVIDKVPFPSKS